MVGGSFTGAQLAPMNMAKSGKGLQIGLFNYYKENFDGFQLGLVNANPDTKVQLMLFGGNTTKLNVGARFKNKLFYTILGGGTHYLDFSDKFSASLFYRAGLELPLYKQLFISGDLGFQHIENFKNKDYGFFPDPARKDLKPVKYISYKKDHFQEDFDFSCEFCGSMISSRDEKCPTCGGNFGNNKEYQRKKRAMQQKYLEYMKSQEKAIAQEMEYISNTMQAIQKYKLIRHKYYNFEIGESPVYKPASDYEFTCEYCANKIRGR